MDILGRDQLSALPEAVVQNQLAQFGDVLWPDIQPPASFFDSGGTGFPQHVRDPHGVKEVLLEEGKKTLSGFAADDDGEHIGVEAVVVEFCSRIAFQGGVEESLAPVGF